MKPNVFILLGALGCIGLGSTQAHAFCGFYVSGADAKLFNEATQVVLMRERTRTVLSMQNHYQGPAEGFAMVIPVPVILQKENVKVLPRAVFDHIDQLSAPRLVEYWEQDPCAVADNEKSERSRMAGARPAAVSKASEGRADYGVTVEAQFTVGEYEVVILSARDATGLDAWLRDNQYKIPQGAEPYLRPYVVEGSKFFVAKVDPSKVKFEGNQVVLSPLRFFYDTEKFNLPIRLGLINSSGTQDLIVHILARGQRYDVANYANVTIPTNLDVADAARDRFGSFYAALFDRTLEATPRSVVTEYAWDAGNCDPCPTPPLSGSDLATLGLDVLTAGDEPVPTPRPGPATARGGRMAFRPSGFVLTRLHARYTKDALGEDLVFKAAPPIAGGREFATSGRTLEKGARPAPINNFQARYAIRHAWTGAMACANPVRGIWGGPPSGTAARAPAAATNLAFAARGDLPLASLLREEVPELGLQAAPVPASTAPDVGSKPASKACGTCAVGQSSESGGPWSLVFAAVLGLVGVRRRHQRPVGGVE
jgi:MYXO-CTERM domain-containing protein